MPSAPLLEIKNLGKYVQVTAVDPDTGIEATVNGPAGIGEAHVRQLALRKLQYLLNKKTDI